MDVSELETMSVEEVANILGIHCVTCYKWIREGKIPVIRLGRSVRVRKQALVAWMKNIERIS